MPTSTILLLIMFSAATPSLDGVAGPNCPGEGDCCNANETPGCDDGSCCDAVCAHLPFCCETEWDALCAAEAAELCSPCAGSSPCTGADGDCAVQNGTPGCNDAQCCEVICGIDAYCCEVAWDLTCVIEAQDLCPASDGCTGTCPMGRLVGSTPPSGTVDARQPHEPNDPSTPLGIGSAAEPITILSSTSNTIVCCLTFSESAVDPTLDKNGFSECVNNGDGTHTIILRRPITPNAVTTISYGDGTYVEFTSHPANVDADGFAGPADVLALVDVINAVAEPAHGLFSSDIDHSGVVTGSDVLREIDLLNGADAFSVQLLSPLPTNEIDNCPGAGSCCQSNGSPGCNDPECCYAVCLDHPLCCSDEWTNYCAAQASLYCDDCAP